MKNTRKLIISFLISLIIVLGIKIVWSSLFKANEKEIYLLVEDVYKGEKITRDNIKSIKVSGKIDIKDCFNVDYVDKIAKENIAKGKVLQQSDIIEENKIEVLDEKYEYISIEVKNISDAVAYQLQKGDIVNVYFTAKHIVNEENMQSIIQDIKTIKILENKKIIGLYDSSGNEVEKGHLYNAIMLRVDKQEAIKLSNIKTEGTFNISLVK